MTKPVPTLLSAFLVLPLLLGLGLSGVATAQTGVLDQDNSLKSNVAWNMGYFNDMQQDVMVGIPGQLEGFTIRMASQNIAVGLPVAIFLGGGYHSSAATPVWSGTAYVTAANTWQEVFVDVSNATLAFNFSDVFVIRVGDASSFTPGVDLTGNSGWPNPFYPHPFYETGNSKSVDRLWFRTYVGGCTGSFTTYGQGCAGSGGIVPVLSFLGCPAPGQVVSLTISKALGGSTALLMFGLGQGQTPMGGGCDLLLNPVLPAPLLFIPVGGSGAGNGSVTLPGLLPATLPVVTVTMQAFVFDSYSAIGGSATNGLQLVIK